MMMRFQESAPLVSDYGIYPKLVVLGTDAASQHELCVHQQQRMTADTKLFPSEGLSHWATQKTGREEKTCFYWH